MDPILVALFLSGSIVFPSSFLTCAFFLRECIQSRAVRFQIATSLTSILQAIMAATAGTYIVVNCYHDFLYARCWLVDVYMCAGAPYMLYDIGAMYTTYHANIQGNAKRDVSRRDTFLLFVKHRKLIILHHVLVGVVGFPIALFYRNGKGDFFLGCVFLTELSTPFVNLRVILRKINRSQTLLYQINNYLILTVYLVCRILIFPVMCWVYSLGHSFSWYHVPLLIPWHCNLGCLILGGFQLFWYLKFVQAIYRSRHRKMSDRNENYSNGAAVTKHR